MIKKKEWNGAFTLMGSEKIRETWQIDFQILEQLFHVVLHFDAVNILNYEAFSGILLFVI